MSVPSSELGPTHPISRKRVCTPPPPQTKGGGTHSPAGEGVGGGGVPIPTTGEKLWILYTLWWWIWYTCISMLFYTLSFLACFVYNNQVRSNRAKNQSWAASDNRHWQKTTNTQAIADNQKQIATTASNYPTINSQHSTTPQQPATNTHTIRLIHSKPKTTDQQRHVFLS